MSTLDIFVEKGRKIGIEAGRKEGLEAGRNQGVENMLLDGFSVEIICKLLAVTPEFVEKVRAGINK